MSFNDPKAFRFPALLAVVFAASFTLVACLETGPTYDPAAAEAERLAVGEAAVAACIASECARLDLDGARLADYSVLAGMTHVTALMLSRTDFSDLADIAAMGQLTELHIADSKVASLAGLSAFPRLKVLHAHMLNDVADFTPIGGLSQLEELSVGNWKDGSVPYIANLRNLKRLNLSSMRLVSTAGLVNHPSLETLDFGEQVLDDLAFLTTIPRLKVLSLGAPYWDVETAKAQFDRLAARGVEITQVVQSPVC